MDLYQKLIDSALGSGGGGGGGSSYELLASTQVTIESDPSTDAELVVLSCGAKAYTSDKILYIKVRRTEKGSSVYMGGDFWVVNRYAVQGYTVAENYCGDITEFYMNGTTPGIQASKYGVYFKEVKANGDVSIWAKKGTYGTCKGTYIIEVYLLSYPNDDMPFK